MIGIFILLFIAMLLVVKFCKKTLKIILAIIISLVTLYCVIISIDKYLVGSMRDPIFVVPTDNVTDNGSGEYKGLGYTVIKEVDLSAEYGRRLAKIEMYMFNKCIAGAISDFDNTQTINNQNEYSFIGKVIESNANTIIVEPNEDEKIRKSSDKIAIGLGEHNDALYMVGTAVKITYDGVIMETYPAQINATKIDLKLAENFEILFYDKHPMESFKIYTILEKNEADNYNYTIYGYDGHVNIIIDGTEYSLKDALLQNKITMSEIISKANENCPKKMYCNDGGSIEYHYENYTIIKCHTIDGNRDVYIGTKDLKLSDVI